MIGDTVRLEGAVFKVEHVKCSRGLIHTVLRVTSNRLFVPHHQLDGATHNAEWTNEPVLTCFTCINHVWRDTELRYAPDDDDDSDDFGVND